MRYFLSIGVASSKHGIFLTKYVMNLLKETSMLRCRSNDTLIDANQKLGMPIDNHTINKESYKRLVSKLIYLSHTRLDIAFVVRVVRQFMHALNKDHMNVVVRILIP